MALSLEQPEGLGPAGANPVAQKRCLSLHQDVHTLLIGVDLPTLLI